MKTYAVQFGFEVIVEADNKDKALELARDKTSVMGLDLYCDGVNELDDRYNVIGD